MKAKWSKWIVVVAVVAVLAGVVTYAARDEAVTLPVAVQDALGEQYPGATVEESEIDVEGIRVYEIELKADGKEFEVTITADGTILEVETEITLNDLPKPVKTAILDAAQGAEIEEVKKEETLYVVTLQKLAEPEISYEAELVQNGEEVELELAADGTVLEREVEHEEDDDDEDADNEHDMDDDDDA